MTLIQSRDEVANGESSGQTGTVNKPHAPVGGHYVAMFWRTPTGVLFSDPTYVASGQTLPDPPDGVQYIVVHPFVASQKSHTMEAFLPANALTGSKKDSETQQQKQMTALPIQGDYGSFSSFLPGRDSTLTELGAEDYAVLNGNSSLDFDVSEQVSDSDFESALQLADRILSEPADSGSQPASEISTDTLRDLGLTPEDVGIDSTPVSEPMSETAESILKENSTMLAKLLELQDKRALSGDYGKISDEEQAMAKKLQTSFARIVSANSPAALRMPAAEIKRAAALLMSNDKTSYAGTLPPQRRFAFMSNMAVGTGVPPGATTTPMQRVPQQQRQQK
ncbi:hypothetical protein H4S08_002515 [Coemansia sp. RSA 1365]|nr:hypothetical protein H4S08_002515 [Coemansia sp. RSA 1365]